MTDRVPASLAALVTRDFRETPLWLDGVDLARPAASPPAAVDVLVIGAGYTGASAALVTAAAGRSTCVIDAQDLGHGCSSRNGGQVATSIKPALDALAARYGTARARAIQQEGIDALEGLRSLVTRQRIDCDWSDTGRFVAACSPRHFDALVVKAQAQARELGTPIDVVPRAEQRREVATDRYHGGVVYPRHASVQPAKLLRGLQAMAADAGAVFVADCAATAIEREKGGFRVNTAGGVIRAARVIIATNGYTGRFSPWHRRRIIPIRSNIIATEPLPPELLERLLPTRRHVVDTARLVVYYRASPDGRRMVFGGRAALFDAPSAVSVPRLLAWLRRLFPELAAARVSHSWSGSVAYTFDELPHIGCADGVHYSMGYCGSGVSLSVHFGRKIGLKAIDHPDGRCALDDIAFQTRPLYTGHPWFLAPSILAYRMIDALETR